MAEKPKDSDAHQRENRAEGFGALLNTHLQRLGELRKAIPEEERNQEMQVPALYVVPNEETLAEPLPPPPRIPATPEQIIRELVLLDIVFPSQALAPEERSLRYQIYCRDLADLTEEELVEACQAYRKSTSARFFPTPGQILNELPLHIRALRWFREK